MEVCQPLRRQREPCRHGMAAAGLQNARLARRDHRGAQVRPGNRTSRSFRQTVSDPGDAGRPIEALLDPTGDNADNARMPRRLR